jgi:hypothetical protein
MDLDELTGEINTATQPEEIKEEHKKWPSVSPDACKIAGEPILHHEISLNSVGNDYFIMNEFNFDSNKSIHLKNSGTKS